jgi:predicted PhzF superfamily epimerase YddE/YHI9
MEVSRILRSVPSFRYIVADVFTDTPLAGNGVAVFTDARERSDALPRRSHTLHS